MSTLWIFWLILFIFGKMKKWTDIYVKMLFVLMPLKGMAFWDPIIGFWEYENQNINKELIEQMMSSKTKRYK